MSFSLRPVDAVDLPFLFQLYASTRAEELAQIPWDAAQKQAFLQMQFDAQRRHYSSCFGGDRHDLIVCEGHPVGRFYVGRWSAEIRVIDISLLPEYRGHRIGAKLLTDLQLEANLQSKRVSIHVGKFNRARHLYNRLGFVLASSGEVHDLMIWEPDPRVRAA
ncbi:MAG: family N-acetyltransferase [Nevskia sp.]|nr:family N-acetyltransferase [Nevskia sp.]